MKEFYLSPQLPADEKAKRIFLTATANTPSSVTAQAAGIALFCKQEGYNPLLLKKALLARSEYIVEIIDIGNSVHEGKCINEVIDRERAERVINQAFDFAQQIKHLSETTLKYIATDLYHQMFDNRTESVEITDQRMKYKVEAMLNY